MKEGSYFGEIRFSYLVIDFMKFLFILTLTAHLQLGRTCNSTLRVLAVKCRESFYICFYAEVVWKESKGTLSQGLQKTEPQRTQVCLYLGGHRRQSDAPWRKDMPFPCWGNQSVTKKSTPDVCIRLYWYCKNGHQ